MLELADSYYNYDKDTTENMVAMNEREKISVEKNRIS